MRAREPDQVGYVERDGVRIAYETFGEGETTIVFTPVDVIVHSRMWKAQVPYLARHFRVVTIDPRGNGRSDRPTDPAAYGDLRVHRRHHRGDGPPRRGPGGPGQRLLRRVAGADLRIPAPGPVHWAWWPSRPGPSTTRHRWLTVARPQNGSTTCCRGTTGWMKYNRNYWLQDWPAFVDFFFGELCNTPHSTKLFEDVTEWARESTGEISSVASAQAPAYAETVEQAEQMLRDVRCPVLVITGTADRCQPQERFDTVARLTGAERLVLEGASHLPMGRDPVVVNRAIRGFVDRIAGTPPPTRGRSHAGLTDGSST